MLWKNEDLLRPAHRVADVRLIGVFATVQKGWHANDQALRSHTSYMITWVSASDKGQLLTLHNRIAP